MGTRSHVHVADSRNDKPFLSMYLQYDGYPSGVGQTIFEEFGNHKICNGYGLEMTSAEYANGMGCLAAQLVVVLKKPSEYRKNNSIGNCYIIPYEENSFQEYNYIIFLENDILYMKCYTDDDIGSTLYDGPLREYGVWLTKYTKEQFEDED